MENSDNTDIASNKIRKQAFEVYLKEVLEFYDWYVFNINSTNISAHFRSIIVKQGIDKYEDFEDQDCVEYTTLAAHESYILL